MQVRTLEQGKTIEELENAINKLAKSKHKTSTELHDLKNEMEMTENEHREKKARSSETVQQLNSELKTTKRALEESRVREKQVDTVSYCTLNPLWVNVILYFLFNPFSAQVARRLYFGKFLFFSQRTEQDFFG